MLNCELMVVHQSVVNALQEITKLLVFMKRLMETIQELEMRHG